LGLFFCLKAVPFVSALFLLLRWLQWESTYGYGGHRHALHAGRSAHSAGHRAIRVDRRPIGGAEYGSQIELSCSEAFAPAWIGHRYSGLGLLFGTDCGYQIFADDPSRIRYADGSFIQHGRLPGDTPPEGHCRIPPDLAIEAVSPNDLARAIEEKVEQWLAAGGHLVWVLYPDTHQLHVHRYDGTVSKLWSDADGVLSGEDVVPGFQCLVAEIFQGL